MASAAAAHHRQQGQSSHVNGKGLWSSWERSFKQPIDAMLDLVDNTVDAHRLAGHDGGGGSGGGGHAGCRIRINRGVHARNYADACIQIMNSASPSPIKDMHKILEVFSSNKNQESIGENGVGVKQASACLSNFSMIITKNENHGPYAKDGGGTIQVGILSKALQRDEGIVLPSYTLPLDRERLEVKLDMLLRDPVFAECIDIFGDKDPDDPSVPAPAAAAATAAAQKEEEDMDSSDDEAPDPVGPSRNVYRENGKDRLLDIIDTMTTGTEWSMYPSVFCLVLARLRLKPADAHDLLKTLQVQMPKTYIHLNPNQADIKIDGKEIQFQYWERRLVELTVFPIVVSRAESILETFDKVSSNKKKKEVGNHWALYPPAPYDTMNVYCGFDAARVQDKTKSSCLHLYIYTRECGRLIKCNDIDARNEVGVGAGSTNFCSGLTVILDDTASTLPLTPTKQDIAWTDAGDQGEIHRLNVYAWLRAVVNMYYTYWKEHAFNKSKEQLTAAVVEFAACQQKTLTCPLQDAAQFTYFTGFNWTIRGQTNNINITSYRDVKVHRQKGSLMRFPPQPKQPAAAVQKPSKKPTPKPAPRTATAAAEEDPDDCSDLDAATADAVASSPAIHAGGFPSSPRKHRAKRPRANDEDAERKAEAELFRLGLREDEWTNQKRELENQNRRLESKIRRLEEKERQQTSELEQAARDRRHLARELSSRVKELENEKISSQQQHGGGAVAAAAPAPQQQAADLLLAQVEQLQAEKLEQSTRHAAEVVDLNRQVEKLKAEKKDLVARLHAKEMKIENLEEEKRKVEEDSETMTTRTIATNTRLREENKQLRVKLAVARQNSVVTQNDEQLDEEDDDDHSDDI